MNNTMVPPHPPPPPPTQYDPHRLEANGGYPSKPDSRTALFLMASLNGITNFLLGTVAFSGFYYATSMRNPLVIGGWEFTWMSSYPQHIYLCVTGYVVLMSQAILAFNPKVGWASNLLNHHKKMVHVAMQIVGSILAITGCIIKMLDSNSNFNSAHSVLGFIALILTVVSLIGGVLNFFCCQQNDRVTLWQILHACFGCLTITVVLMAMIVAYYKYFSDNLSIVFTGLTLVAFVTSVVVQVIKRI